MASGAGAASRHSIGTGVFVGMLFATMVGIFFIPLFFRVIRGLADRGGAASRGAGSGLGRGGDRMTRRSMTAVSVALTTLLGLAACAVGPSYRPAEPVAAGTRVGAAHSPPATARVLRFAGGCARGGQPVAARLGAGAGWTA